MHLMKINKIQENIQDLSSGTHAKKKMCQCNEKDI